MSRIAVVILTTGIAFVALIILAGRTDWSDVSYRVSSGAIDALTDDDATANEPRATIPTLSDPATWNREFMRGALASADCPTDTLENVRTRMAAVGPYTVAQYERTIASYRAVENVPGPGVAIYNRVSEIEKRSITATDRIYAFGFSADTGDSGTRAFSGYFVTRDDCIVHVEVTSFDN